MSKTYPFTVTIAVIETKVYEYEVLAENESAAANLARAKHYEHDPEDGKSVWVEEMVHEVSCEDETYYEEEAEEA